MTADATETAENRLRRLRMRSWRRGTREMDLILGPYADARLTAMDADALDGYEAVLAESDPDLMAWITGQGTPPAALSAAMERIAAFTQARPCRDP